MIDLLITEEMGNQQNDHLIQLLQKTVNFLIKGCKGKPTLKIKAVLNLTDRASYF